MPMSEPAMIAARNIASLGMRTGIPISDESLRMAGPKAEQVIRIPSAAPETACRPRATKRSLRPDDSGPTSRARSSDRLSSRMLTASASGQSCRMASVTGAMATGVA
ncbi:hypothetical protein D3C87_1754280 [compost metagenome]